MEYKFKVGDKVRYSNHTEANDGVLTVEYVFESDYGVGPMYVVNLVTGKSRTAREDTLELVPVYPAGTMIWFFTVGAFYLKSSLNGWRWVGTAMGAAAESIYSEDSLRQAVGDGRAEVVYDPTRSEVVYDPTYFAPVPEQKTCALGCCVYDEEYDD